MPVNSQHAFRAAESICWVFTTLLTLQQNDISSGGLNCNLKAAAPPFHCLRHSSLSATSQLPFSVGESAQFGKLESTAHHRGKQPKRMQRIPFGCK